MKESLENVLGAVPGGISPNQKWQNRDLQDWTMIYISETWPVQNENTSIQYLVWFLNTDVSVSVFNLKNAE